MSIDGDLNALQRYENLLEGLPHDQSAIPQTAEFMRSILAIMNTTLWDIFGVMSDVLGKDLPFPPMFLEAKTISTTWIQLDWTSAVGPTGHLLTEHLVSRSDDGGATYPNEFHVAYPLDPMDPDSGPPWTDNDGGGGLTPDTNYWYKAVGTNDQGDSKECKPILVHTLAV